MYGEYHRNYSVPEFVLYRVAIRALGYCRLSGRVDDRADKLSNVRNFCIIFKHANGIYCYNISDEFVYGISAIVNMIIMEHFIRR